jgi:hypothetical protein
MKKEETKKSASDKARLEAVVAAKPVFAVVKGVRKPPEPKRIIISYDQFK